MDFCIGILLLGYEDTDTRGDDGDMGDALDFVDLGSTFLAGVMAVSSHGGQHSCVGDTSDRYKCWGYVPAPLKCHIF